MNPSIILLTELFSIYWFLGLGLYGMIDLCHFPKQWYLTKIQKDKKLNLEQYLHIGKIVLINQIICISPILYIFEQYIMPWRYQYFTLPYYLEFILAIPFFSFIEELLFYYSHFLLHHPRIYRHIHKIHHRYTSPVAIAALYAHPLEIILCNVIPFIAGPILLGAPLLIYKLWFYLGIINILNSHCGYELPFMPSPRFHDLHHKLFNINYGVFTILDNKLKTYMN